METTLFTKKGPSGFFKFATVQINSMLKLGEDNLKVKQVAKKTVK